MRLRSFFKAWWPAIAWMTLIFTLSHQPSLPSFDSSVADLLSKKGGHLIEYTVLATLCLRALRQMPARTHPAYWAFIVTVLYAMSDEWHQTFIPGRNGHASDVLIDGTGAILGLAAAYLWGHHQSGAGRARKPTPDSVAGLSGRRDSEVAGET